MSYTDYHWIADRLAVGAFVHQQHDDFPFDAVMSMETHAPATLRSLALAEDMEYLWFSIIDGYSWETHDEIVRRFDEAAAQIDDWLSSDKTVLVHCTAGISRSVTAVVWYLMKYQGYTWQDAVDLVRSFREQANPNPRFEVPLGAAAGEEITAEWLEARINAYCARMAEEIGIDFDPRQLWEDLERQGTLAHTQALMR